MFTSSFLFSFFFFNVPATTEIYTLSLHDALPISAKPQLGPEPIQRISLAIFIRLHASVRSAPLAIRSEEHTSELQSRVDLVCRLLLEKKKKIKQRKILLKCTISL